MKNKKMKIIAVGGVAGGATAIARLRRLDENAEIILLEKGEYVSFANCGLPYYLGDVIKEREALFVSDITSIKNKYNVEIRNFSELIKIVNKEKYVEVKNLKTGEVYQESYDKLLLSTGSTPFIPNIEGVDADNVFTLWNIPDTDRIYDFIQDKKPASVVVVGGGFIGLEMAENMKERGLDVTLVELSNQVMAPLDKDMTIQVENHLIEKGIKLLLETGVEAIKNSGKEVLLSTGETIKSDMILLSIGIRPNTGYLKDGDLALNNRGGLIVDELLNTNDKDIYAVGDMIEITHGVSNNKMMIPLAGPANKQARAVAANILGLKTESYHSTIGTSIAKIFDLSVASTGLNEKMLKSDGLKRWQDYGVALIHPMSHAGYYPNALPFTLKLLFNLENGVVLGAQAVGYDGIDKAIDTIATSINFKATVYDLTKLELAYAPPFSSAKNPVNMVGYVACDIMEKLSEPITYDEWSRQRDQFITIDVREEIEYLNGSIEGAVNIPLSQLRQRYQELDIDKKYVVFCAVGLRGYIAERILKQKNYQVRNLMGGFRTYAEHNADGDLLRANIQLDQDKINLNNEMKTIELNVCGLSCPGPIVKVSKEIEKLQVGELLTVKATDPGFVRDIESWCDNTGNKLLEKTSNKGIYHAVIMKQLKGGQLPSHSLDQNKEKTMIVFDGDLDKAIAAFIIATGSAAMGNKVNMFFTFWGLNILRKNDRVKVKKDFISKMFALMMPCGSQKLALSKMNFGGMGSLMMKKIMKKKGITSLEELIKEAQDAGVKMTACQMSMDVMGITKEELIDGVNIGGVATMLNDNDKSNMNLFI